MTEPRNEFGFEEWQSSADSFEEVPEWKSRAIWHAALDAVRAKLAAKELWIAPMIPDDEMIEAADDGDREYTKRVFGAGIPLQQQGPYDHYIAMRESYLSYYGNDYESGL